MLTNLVVEAICDEKGAIEKFNELITRYTKFNDVVGKFKSLAKSKELDEEQTKFLQRTILDSTSLVNLQVLESLKPLVNKVAHLLKTGSAVGKKEALRIIKLICIDSEAFIDILNQFISGANGVNVTAAEDEQEFFPITEPEEEISVDENTALESENRLLADFWQKRELAESLMSETDRFYEYISSEENRGKIPQNLQVRISSFLENYKDIPQVFEEQKRLIDKVQQEVMFHITKGEFFSQTTLSSLVRLVYLFEFLITFGLTAVQLSSELERTSTLACVIFGSKEIDYETLDTMKEIVLRLEEAT